MSTPTRKPYLSDEDLIGYITTNGVTMYSQHRMSPVDVRDKYEAHLAEQEQTIADLRARVEATEADERRWRKTVERIMAVCTPHVSTPEGRMTYTGPDIAERFALLSDEIVNALPTPTPTDHE